MHKGSCLCAFFMAQLMANRKFSDGCSTFYFGEGESCGCHLLRLTACELIQCVCVSMRACMCIACYVVAALTVVLGNMYRGEYQMSSNDDLAGVLLAAFYLRFIDLQQTLVQFIVTLFVALDCVQFRSL